MSVIDAFKLALSIKQGRNSFIALVAACIAAFILPDLLSGTSLQMPVMLVLCITAFLAGQQFYGIFTGILLESDEEEKRKANQKK